MERNPELGRQAALDRIASQLSVQDKIAAATWVIWNDDDEIELRRSAREIFDAVVTHGCG
jgi:dephospho-CoA kinase